ncbi:MAG: FAD-dependent oxidoreductase, partial [Ignavibacteriae bacterium]|nr:FAD-dependent oxidoreductase [Ignavibacteriota bacterium]
MQNFLTDAQLRAEIAKCEFCEEKPCKEACPVDCSPADFIMAVKRGHRQDYSRSAAIIMGSNPLGGICGSVCPDYHCMKACVHRTFDNAVKIPPVQATIIKKAKESGKMPVFNLPASNGLKIAVIGAGPAGLGAASVLIQKGYSVDIFEKNKLAGVMCNLIPDIRLDKDTLRTDIDFLMNMGDVNIFTECPVVDPAKLLDNYSAVIVTTGRDKELTLRIKGEEHSIQWINFLSNQKNLSFNNLKIAVIGGGAVAVDCAITAKLRKADTVEMICLEKYDEMPLTAHERQLILDYGIEVTGRTKIESIIPLPKNFTGDKNKSLKGLKLLKGVNTSRVILPKGKKFHPANMLSDKVSGMQFRDFDVVIIAIGSKPGIEIKNNKKLFYAGDIVNGPTTVVEAVAAGKNAAFSADVYLHGQPKPGFKNSVKSRI